MYLRKENVGSQGLLSSKTSSRNVAVSQVAKSGVDEMDENILLCMRQNWAKFSLLIGYRLRSGCLSCSLLYENDEISELISTITLHYL